MSGVLVGSGMVARVRCEWCEHEHEVSEPLLAWGVINGKRLRFMLSRCNCGKYNVCQIDDKNTIDILQKLVECMVSVSTDGNAEARARGVMLRKKLKNARNKLNRLYEGKRIKFYKPEYKVREGWRLRDAL